MDFYKVINLGHKANVPLIQSSSELTDGLEPHDCFWSRGPDADVGTAVRVGWGCTRGGAAAGYREGLYRVLTRVQIQGQIQETLVY